jgi:3-hydroxyisobutyrate dehydrogenase
MLPDGAILRTVYADIVPAAQPRARCSSIARRWMLTALARPMRWLPRGGCCRSMRRFRAVSVGLLRERSPSWRAAATRRFARRAAVRIMGKKAVHCGAAGAGQSAKICNNMLLGISMIGTCEAFALAEKLGLSAQSLFDVVSTSSGSCWSVNTYCPVPGVGPQSPADNGYKPGFAAELMLKDLKLSQQAAQRACRHGRRWARARPSFMTSSSRARARGAISRR